MWGSGLKVKVTPRISLYMSVKLKHQSIVDMIGSGRLGVSTPWCANREMN